MSIDPYHAQMTVAGRLRQKMIEAWPTIYNIINTITNSIFSALAEMIKSAFRAFKL